MSRIRVTSRTDTRGTVNQEYRGLYEQNALAAAHAAGIPGDFLAVEGWNGDPNDLEGYFAHLIYEVGDASFTAPDCIERLSGLIDQLHAICRNVGVSPVDAMGPVYDMAKFKRELHEVRGAQRAIAQGTWEPPMTSESEVCWGEW